MQESQFIIKPLLSLIGTSTFTIFVDRLLKGTADIESIKPKKINNIHEKIKRIHRQCKSLIYEQYHNTIINKDTKSGERQQQHLPQADIWGIYMYYWYQMETNIQRLNKTLRIQYGTYTIISPTPLF